MHDPEFAPSVDVILSETLPALEACRRAGKLRYIGITGYPLAVLRELAERSPVKIDTCISYCHYNLHDRCVCALGATCLSVSSYVASGST